MPEKKVGIQAGFVTRWLGAAGGVYFQTGLFRRGGRLRGGLAMGSGRVQKKRPSSFFLGFVNYCWWHADGKG